MYVLLGKFDCSMYTCKGDSNNQFIDISLELHGFFMDFSWHNSTINFMDFSWVSDFMVISLTYIAMIF